MALNNAALDIAAPDLRAAILYVSLHTAAPDATGSNQSAAARQPVTWTAVATGGDFSATAALNFTGGASNGAATHVGLWSALTVGTFYGWFALTGDQTFNAAGEYSVNTLAITGTAT